MRVALVTNFCPHYRRPLFLELARRVELTLILTSRGAEPYWEGETPYEAPGVRTVLANSALKVRRELRSGDYDVVVSALNGRATLLATALTTRRLNVPLVLWVGIWEHPQVLVHRLSRPLVRSLYRSADAIVTYGTHISRYVARESGRTERVFVAPQAVDNAHFRTQVPPDELTAFRRRLGLGANPVILFVGRLTTEKGLDYMLEACGRVTSPYELVIAGAGPLLDVTREQAKTRGISEHVKFLGNVDQHDLPTVLQASDLLVLPSVSTPAFRETWGLVVNEAMNAGLPVIATDAVGAAAGGLVVDGKTGLVVPEKDATALAAALEDLLSDTPKRQAMGEAARGHVLGWNYSAASDAFVEAIEAVAHR